MIYKDKAGNSLNIEQGKLAGRNAEGKLISSTELKKFIKRPQVRKALNRNLGGQVIVHNKPVFRQDTRRLPF